MVRRISKVLVSTFGLLLIVWGILGLIRLTDSYRLETKFLTTSPDYPRIPLFQLFLGYIAGILVILLGFTVFSPFWNFLKPRYNIDVPAKKRVRIILALISGLVLIEILNRVFFPISSGYINRG